MPFCNRLQNTTAIRLPDAGYRARQSHQRSRYRARRPKHIGPFPLQNAAGSGGHIGTPAPSRHQNAGLSPFTMSAQSAGSLPRRPRRGWPQCDTAKHPPEHARQLAPHHLAFNVQKGIDKSFHWLGNSPARVGDEKCRASPRLVPPLDRLALYAAFRRQPPCAPPIPIRTALRPGQLTTRNAALVQLGA